MDGADEVFDAVGEGYATAVVDADVAASGFPSTPSRLACAVGVCGLDGCVAHEVVAP